MSNKLNITFHNPNTEDDTVRELIKIFASSISEQTINRIIHKTIITNKNLKTALDETKH